jgi:hypothetical protein
MIEMGPATSVAQVIRALRMDIDRGVREGGLRAVVAAVSTAL